MRHTAKLTRKIAKLHRETLWDVFIDDPKSPHHEDMGVISEIHPTQPKVKITGRLVSDDRWFRFDQVSYFTNH